MNKMQFVTALIGLIMGILIIVLTFQGLGHIDNAQQNLSNAQDILAADLIAPAYGEQWLFGQPNMTNMTIINNQSIINQSQFDIKATWPDSITKPKIAQLDSDADPNPCNEGDILYKGKCMVDDYDCEDARDFEDPRCEGREPPKNEPYVPGPPGTNGELPPELQDKGAKDDPIEDEDEDEEIQPHPNLEQSPEDGEE